MSGMPRSPIEPAGDGTDVRTTRPLRNHPSSSGAARRFVEEMLAGHDDDAKATAVLLTSELVTNALLHGRFPCSVTVAWGDDTIRVEVADRSDALPAPVEAPEDADAGRGLIVVEALAKRWGAHPRSHGGKVVWFEVPARG
jgi:two-component sensor histidine kinase